MPDEISSENRLNGLSAKEWLKFTKTWFVHNPPPRKKDEVLHPAKYPEGMIEDFIKFFTKPGAVVFDPFLGTGSTLVACYNSQRNGIGIELQEKYAKIAEARIKKLDSQQQLSLNAETGSKKLCKQLVIKGNSSEIENFWKEFSLPKIDFVITSPPYGPMLNKKGLASKEREDDGLDIKYSDDENDLGNARSYEDFLNRLSEIFIKLKDLVRDDGYLVVILQNYMDKGDYRTLAWDFAHEMKKHYQMRGERIWCFHPDTLIWTISSPKKIKDITKKDFVLTHRGNFQAVKKVFESDYSGEVISIIPKCLNQEIICTPNHEILCIPRKYWPNSNAFQPFFRLSKSEPQWIRAEMLKKGDILLLPKINLADKEIEIDLTNYTNKELLFLGDYFTTLNQGGQTILPRKLKITPEFCRLAGYYISEGHGSAKVAMSISSYDPSIREDIISCFNIVFPKVHLNVTKKEVVCYSRLLSEIFANLFGSHANIKKIPFLMISLNQECLRQLLIGLWKGDGSISSSGAYYKTISKMLADSLLFVLLRLGLLPTIQTSDKHGIQITLKGRNLKVISELLGYKKIVFFRNRINNHTWNDDEYFYIPIRKTQKKEYKGKVYNLMVESDNSYVTYSFSSHNCQDNKTLYPYGYRYSFVPNVHHHYCLIFKKKADFD